MTTRLVLDLQGDRQVRVTRSFAAPPGDVFRAHIEPALMRRWMSGPPGWKMTRCDCDGREGGDFRHEWTDADGANGFAISGTFRTLDRPGRIVHVERMHLPDPTPDNEIETTFEAQGTGTRMVMVMTLPDAATRAQMLDTGMEEGMEESYARIDGVMGAA